MELCNRFLNVQLYIGSISSIFSHSSISFCVIILKHLEPIFPSGNAAGEKCSNIRAEKGQGQMKILPSFLLLLSLL